MAKIRPRKHAVQARSRATIAAIREATARILAERGLGAVTTNAVAERAGVSIGSLYQYFPGRDAILADLLRDKLTALLDDIETATEAPGFDAATRAMLTGLARSYLARPALASALLYVETLIGDDAEIAGMRRRLGEAVVGFLVRHDISEPEIAARDIVAMTRALAMTAGLAGETDEAAVVDRMARAVSGYLGRTP
ncbi:TetR/AcrR family transcriptional regulator [Jannaschia formosa]|uniref:TetR/AcrR family transcriptional regulator n=1 Tax=Jannaschia formosa TaxID=2259592 RepID=UPI00143123FC|nr:TetR/AcrR family transcriptional regulator [Jannaschia formosa]